MKVLIACDSFKESASSIQVAECINQGILEVSNVDQIKILPVADGGEGTLESFAYNLEGSMEKTLVPDPLSREVYAKWLLDSTTQSAFIESAQTIGLQLVKSAERNPLKAHTRGLGILIKDAIAKGAKNIYVGIGGSSTNDGGQGMLSELGIQFLNSSNQHISVGNYGLRELINFKKDHWKDIEDIRFVVACDVTNPLTGPEGATYTYGKQKGSDDKMLDEMESNMENYRKVLIEKGKEDPNTIPGSGAAGGLGCAFSLFLNAELRSGFEIISEVSNLEQEIISSDLVITGEGRIDSQSLHGKLPVQISNLARKHKKPVVGVAGKIDDPHGQLKALFNHTYDIISKADNLNDAMQNYCQFLKEIGKEIAQIYLSK